jgi:hypothetical protein
LVVDARTDDVRRYQVGGELHAMELAADRRRERLDGERLGQPRHPLDQDVPAREQRHQQPLEEHVLPDDGLLHLVEDLLHRAGRGDIHALSFHHCSGARSP